MILHKNEFNDHDMGKLVKGAIVPRPIAWVSSMDGNGRKNLAPFSFFTVASMDPLTLAISVGEREREKDTAFNIKETEEFVVNIVSESLANAMHETSRYYSAEEDEFEVAGITEAESVYVRTPRVMASPVSFECRLTQVMEIGTSNLILGEVIGYHLRDDIYMEKDKVDPHKLQAIGRMAGDYTFVRDFFPLPTDQLPE
ncbi:flavin reductase family protein [Salimicrobium salexigens]|uniref:NADH-FMN oxidoreductase RutF, flavin reductase (DIM6/NTAB) family n=1 Tax=Salimicrobium salexigens TaxID=908941 RepID=A0ABY1KW63_9BACI|nr:flavin reductase family protein [Salimicrobium salexigens]SIS85656.1 NADH-FMN oxidoreductase RutF, flavin reductase (DIM6/NTAB) family [Salimicrobium salexigens]